MKTVAEEVASKYQMGFPAVTTPDTTPPVAPVAEPVTAQPPKREQDAETGRVTFTESDRAVALTAQAERVARLNDAVAALAAVEQRAAESAQAFKAAMVEIVRLTTLARHSSTNEAAEHVTTIEKFAQGALRKLV